MGIVWIFGDRSQPQFKETASRRLFRRRRPPHIFVGREKDGRRENLSVRIRSPRRHWGDGIGNNNSGLYPGRS